MARMIDAIELRQRMCALCNQDYSDEPCEPSDCVFVRAINETPTLTPPNEPLTSDELRQMDGEPVYIVFSPDTDGEKLQFWALVAVDKWGEVYLMNNLGGSSAYEEVWANIEAVYRRPPHGPSSKNG